MEFVSKDQTYEATRKFLTQWGAHLHDGAMEEVARKMARDNGDGPSAEPELYHTFLDGLMSDPLAPKDALSATAEFLEKTFAEDPKQETQQLIEAVKATADDPRSDLNLWNEWIKLLESV